MKRNEFLRLLSAVPALAVGGSALLNSCANDSSNKNFIFPSSDTISPDAISNKNLDSLLIGQTVINEDTLNTSYEKPLIENYNRNRYCDIVAQNAEKEFPDSKPYLEWILKFNTDYRSIFDIPPEYIIGLLHQESKFNPSAVSYAPAVGIAQFMRPTAQDMGMKVYNKRQFKELYECETNLKTMNKKVNDTYNKAITAFNANSFDVAKTYKLEYDTLLVERGKFLGTAKYMYLNVLKELDDDRKSPQISIDMSTKYLAFLCRDAEKYFKGKHIHNILRGLAAYNSGFANVKKGYGLPFIKETVGYVRNILLWADKITPQQLSELMYDSNPQIISELVTSRIYSLNDLGNTPKK